MLSTHNLTNNNIMFGMVMREYTFQELCAKQVINVAEGRNLGHIFDLSFTCTGQVCGLIVVIKRSFFKTINSADSLFIPWNNIIKIGSDVILVEMIGANCGCGILSADENDNDDSFGDEH